MNNIDLQYHTDRCDHFFSCHNQEWISSFLVWSVQSIIFIDSSGCLCLIQPSNKKWKIYRVGSLKSAKVFAFKLLTLSDTFAHFRKSTFDQESFVLMQMFTHAHTQHSHWYTIELFKYSHTHTILTVVYICREKWILVCDL